MSSLFNLRMKKSTVFILFFTFLSVFSFAQTIDSVKVDSAKIVKTTKDSVPVKKAKFIPVPKKALLYSIIPGGGQIYNRKLWYIKLPIVYGALITGGVVTQYNSTYYKYFKNNYYNKVNGLPLDNSKVRYIENISADVLKKQRDYFFKSMQQSYAITSILYILSAAEAFTSAHLMNFDISPDLSFKVKPSFEALPVGTTAGIGVQLKF